MTEDELLQHTNTALKERLDARRRGQAKSRRGTGRQKEDDIPEVLPAEGEVWT